MDTLKKNLVVLVNIVTLLVVFCTAIYGYGRLNARVDSVETRQDKTELSDIEIKRDCQSIMFKLGKIEGKIDTILKKD